jgi:hypothetical protein
MENIDVNNSDNKENAENAENEENEENDVSSLNLNDLDDNYDNLMSEEQYKKAREEDNGPKEGLLGDLDNLQNELDDSEYKDLSKMGDLSQISGNASGVNEIPEEIISPEKGKGAE